MRGNRRSNIGNCSEHETEHRNRNTQSEQAPTQKEWNSMQRSYVLAFLSSQLRYPVLYSLYRVGFLCSLCRLATLDWVPILSLLRCILRCSFGLPLSVSFLFRRSSTLIIECIYFRGPIKYLSFQLEYSCSELSLIALGLGWFPLKGDRLVLKQVNYVSQVFSDLLAYY